MMAKKPDDIRVKATRAHMRGQRVAGLGGRTYYCNPQTGLLHLVLGPSTFAEKAGVHADCANRLRKFSGYEVEKRPPPPPRRAKATPASGESEAGDVPPDSAPSDAGSSGAPAESESLASILPEDDDEWTIKQWLSNATDLGVEMTEDEQAMRPKAALVSIIRSKALELEAPTE